MIMKYPENLLLKINIEIPILSTDQSDGLDYAISQLPLVMRDVVLFHYQKDMRFTKIAPRIGRSDNWVRNCHQHALKRLRKYKDYIIYGYKGELERQRDELDRLEQEEQDFRDNLRTCIGAMADNPLRDYLPSRIVRALSKEGIITISDLAVMYQREPDKYIRGLGKKLRGDLDDFFGSLRDQIHP